MSQQAIKALVEKRAELAGQLAPLEREATALRGQINHLDHVLVMLGYDDPDRIRPKRPTVNRFKHRELSIFVRELQREGLSVSNREAALRLIEAKGWDTSDADLLGKVSDSIKSAKRHLRTSRRAFQP